MRKELAFFFVVLLLMVSCSSMNQQSVRTAMDPSYGYSPDNPIYCGKSLIGEKEYLSRLRGPQGQWVKLTRLPACCHFKLPGGSDGETGHISRWEVHYAGMPQPVILYLNSFGRQSVRAPDGFALAR